MPPFVIFALGALVGAGATLLAPGLSRNGRPMLKEALKSALLLAHEAQVRGAELLEMAEDLYAEASVEAAAAKNAKRAAPAATAPRVRRPTQRKRATARRATAGTRARAASKRIAKTSESRPVVPADHA